MIFQIWFRICPITKKDSAVFHTERSSVYLQRIAITAEATAICCDERAIMFLLLRLVEW